MLPINLLFRKNSLVGLRQFGKFVKQQGSASKPVSGRSIGSLSVLNSQFNGIPETTVVTTTNKDLINSDIGLSKFVNRTYLWTGGSVIGTILLSTSLAQGIFPAHPTATVIGGVLLSFGGIFGIMKSAFTINREIIAYNHVSSPTTSPPVLGEKERVSHESTEALSSTNTPQRLAAYAAFVTGMSMTAAPVFFMYPGAIMPALLSSSTVFGAAALYAYARPAGSLSTWGPTLTAGVGGLIGVTVVSWLSEMIFGPTGFAMALNNVQLYAGIPIFAGFIAYDTNQAIAMYNSKYPDHLGCSTQLYLDFMNIFLRFVQIIGEYQRNR
jgi:FtsH-binding integral membrane protein